MNGILRAMFEAEKSESDVKENLLLVYSVNTKNGKNSDSNNVRNDIRNHFNEDKRYKNISNIDTAYIAKHSISSEDVDDQRAKAKKEFIDMLTDIAKNRECSINAFISITELGLIEINLDI
ncbi:hypothetical protein [Pseudoalteromonas sp. NJ631]|uniref:hypothetical protein n=1 Tax=Pseudoalteromonas sp. NJ631 TaxID=493915 RepID=UPI0002DF9C4F|nr:hypothetical protein [Pseudoalteromonas sp. NJ631]